MHNLVKIKKKLSKSIESSWICEGLKLWYSGSWLHERRSETLFSCDVSSGSQYVASLLRFLCGEQQFIRSFWAWNLFTLTFRHRNHLKSAKNVNSQQHPYWEHSRWSFPTLFALSASLGGKSLLQLMSQTKLGPNLLQTQHWTKGAFFQKLFWKFTEKLRK